MILLGASFISKSMSRPLTGHRLTQLLAIAPRMSDDLNLVSSPSSSIPFTLMSAFAIAISYADRSNLSTAIIPMAAAFQWDSFFSGLVLSSFWAGYALTQVLGGKLADKYGGERLLVFAIVVWSICTALTPTAAELGNVQIISMRVLLGAGEGLALPAIHSMIQRYVRPSEISTSASVVTAACYLGALISNLISPSIISQYGWQACFLYFAALPPLVWLPLWGLIFGKKGFGLQDDTQIIEVLNDDTGSSGVQKIQQFDSQSSGDDIELKIKLNDMSSVDSKVFYEAPTTSSSSQSMDTEERIITLSPSPSSSSSSSAKSSSTVKNKVYVAKAKINADNTVYDIAPQSTYVRDDWTVDSTESDPLIKSVTGNSAENKEVSGIQKYEKTTEKENEKLNEKLNEIGNEKDNQEVLPLSYLLSSRPVWAIMAAQYGQSWGMIGLLSWLPTYYSERFHVPLDSLANFTVLPYFLQMIVGISAGLIADKLISSGVRTLTVRKSLQISGMLVPAGCLALCAYLPSLDATTAAAFITFGSAISAITVAAVSANHFDISPKNAGTIFGIGNTVGCIGGLIAVPSSGFLYDQTHNWDAVFLLFAFHYIAGAFLWSIWASDQPLNSPILPIKSSLNSVM